MRDKNIRIIPRLDVKGPNLVKGICFEGYRVLGRPETFARKYADDLADEIILYDVMASLVRRPPGLEVISRVADQLFIPLTVAGGIRSVSDIHDVLMAGADKVAINTGAVENPELLQEAALAFGAQCIVSAIEAFRHDTGEYEVWTDYGRQPTGLNVFDWVNRVIDLGVGEILLSSINRDGTGEGYDLELTERVAAMSPVPVVASGGAGNQDDFSAVIVDGMADAVSAASVFHYQYAEKVDSVWMSYHEPTLRRGADIDAGNIEFLNDGYGEDRGLLVTPCTLTEVKSHLADANIGIRTRHEDAARA